MRRDDLPDREQRELAGSGALRAREVLARSLPALNPLVCIPT